MRGKKHVGATQNVFCLEFGAPEGFDVHQWSEDYMARVWAGETEQAEEMTS